MVNFLKYLLSDLGWHWKFILTYVAYAFHKEFFSCVQNAVGGSYSTLHIEPIFYVNLIAGMLQDLIQNTHFFKVAELGDALASGASELWLVEVKVLFSHHFNSFDFKDFLFFKSLHVQ